jgi:membrane protein
MGAALAYYTVFSLSPLLIIVVAVAGALFGEKAARGQLARQMESLVGAEGALAIEQLLKSATETSGVGASMASIVVFLFGAMAVFGELQDSLNTIWKAPSSPGRGLFKLVRERLLSFSMILVVAFLLLVLLVFSAILQAAVGWFNGWLTASLVQMMDFLASFAVVTGLFALIYKLLPEARIAWKDVWLGAAVTAVLFLCGRLLIGMYLGRSSLTSAFGAAGSLAVLLVWFYYSAQVFLFGAELTYQYAHRYGSGILGSDGTNQNPSA